MRCFLVGKGIGRKKGNGVCPGVIFSPLTATCMSAPVSTQTNLTDPYIYPMSGNGIWRRTSMKYTQRYQQEKSTNSPTVGHLSLLVKLKSCNITDSPPSCACLVDVFTNCVVETLVFLSYTRCGRAVHVPHQTALDVSQDVRCVSSQPAIHTSVENWAITLT
ncbi:hypothetical protein BaRGS_00004503 [Batillaria attramentaria]|uniref:Uncharacterized protein n=1 Tax=Batillaria attramentaria TaxID=370345 RepID=A0ABD0LX36_9CAEN